MLCLFIDWICNQFVSSGHGYCDPRNSCGSGIRVRGQHGLSIIRVERLSLVLFRSCSPSPPSRRAWRKGIIPRVYATFNFSLNLSTVLIFVIAIFDVCAVDTRAAATLRLSPLQAAAVVTCGVVVLSAFAGYIVSEQRRPSKQAARAAFLSMVFSNQFCFIVVGRLVWVVGTSAKVLLAAADPIRDVFPPRACSRRRISGVQAAGPRGWCV